MATVPSGQSSLPSASFVTQAEPEQPETEQPSQKRGCCCLANWLAGCVGALAQLCVLRQA